MDLWLKTSKLRIESISSPHSSIDEPLHVAEHTGAIELEFEESMKNRLEKGYTLPGQTEILYPAGEVMAKLQKRFLVCISTLAFKICP